MGKRDRTRKMIIEESSRCFMTEGIAAASMEEVARVTGLHRRTLYRYFPGKEDLLLEIVMEKIGEINRYQKSLLPELKGNGLARFSAFLRGLIGYMTENREMVRFLDEFDYQISDKNRFPFSREQSDEFKGIAHETESLLLEIIALGIKDESITLTHEPSLFVATVTTMLWGAAQKAAVRGDILEEEYGLSLQDMVNCQIDLYVRAIDGIGRRE